jgi:AcrR family transcriptional regulator
MTESNGGLGERLLRTALQRLEEAPADRLSLRQVAQAVGVSHQAPYVHFGSKRRFLAAVAGAGMHRAAADATAAVAAAAADPRSRLHALVDAYVSFITSQPHVLDLAYRPDLAKGDHPLLQQAAIEYWDLVHDTVEACQPPGTSEPEILRRCTAVWGTVYGMARLQALHQIPASVPGDPMALVHEAVEALLQGWWAGPPVSRGGVAEA